MREISSMILVTGAAGKTGRAVIQKLVTRQQNVRALVRRPEQAALLEQLGVQESIIGNLAERATMETAVVGAQAVYHICPNMHPQELKIGQAAIRAAQSAGVERFVYHSVLHPQVEIMAHHWQTMRVEEQLFESGLSFTILQPAAYMQNVLTNWDRIFKQGLYTVPYALDTRLSMVDLMDVAEVAAKVLVEAGHEGAIYELCGAEIVTQREIANILAQQLDRRVRAEVVAIETWEQNARSAGLSDYAVEALAEMFQYYERFGFWGNSQVLGWLLGRAPTTFADFLERTVDAQT